MYYKAVESSTKAKKMHDMSLVENAKTRLRQLSSVPTKRKEDCAYNRKAGKALTTRQKDFDLMTGRMDFKAPIGAYHRPGSMNYR